MGWFVTLVTFFKDQVRDKEYGLDKSEDKTPVAWWAWIIIGIGFVGILYGLFSD